MKNVFVIILVLLGSILKTTVSFSQNNSEKEKTLCKSWYVKESFEIRLQNNEKKITKRAQGTEFTFKPDHSFDFDIKSEDRSIGGVWKFMPNDSISLDLNGNEIIFFIKFFNSDSMYLIGQENSNTNMHILFSSSFVAPYKKSYLEPIDLETEEIKAIPDEAIEKITTPITDIDVTKLCKTWYIISREMRSDEDVESLPEELINGILTFRTDKTIKFIDPEDGEIENGTWEITENNKLILTLDNQPLTFEVIELSDEELNIVTNNDGVRTSMTFSHQPKK